MGNRAAQTPLGLCRECGDEIEDFMAPESEVCFGCHEFYQERECRALWWAEEMERIENERAR